MKIVIIQGAFLPVPAIQGGAVEKIWDTMGQMFVHEGHEVIHISKQHTSLPDEEIRQGVRHIRVKGYDAPAQMLRYKWLDLLYSKRVIKIIPADVDIIVTNTFWLPILLRGEMSKKVYVDVQRVPKGQMFLYKHAGKLRACSKAIYDSILKELPPKSHNMVSYVPNPIPFRTVSLIAEKEKIILFVGRLHHEKGVDLLIKAFSFLPKKIQNDWQLVIVGPYEIKDGGSGYRYYEQLQQEANTLNVVFKGSIYEPNELTYYYAKSRIFCYPVRSDSGDAAPVAPREAMAYGAVPVVSSLACFSDFITDERNGLVFDNTTENPIQELLEKILKLAENETLLEKLSHESRKINERFSPDLIAKKFIDDFKLMSNAGV